MSTRRPSLRDKPSIFGSGYAGEGKKARKEESKADAPLAAKPAARPAPTSPRWRKANWLVREDRFYELKLLAAKRRTSLYKLLEEALTEYLARQNRAS